MAKKDSNRCWPGYEPVPGKPKNSKGSCRPKAESKLTSGEKDFREKRRKQLDKWQSEHPGSPRQAAQHLSAPDPSKAKAGKQTHTASKSRKSSSKRSQGSQK